MIASILLGVILGPGVGGGERGVVDFGKLFTETNEQKFSLGGVQS